MQCWRARAAARAARRRRRWRGARWTEGVERRRRRATRRSGGGRARALSRRRRERVSMLTADQYIRESWARRVAEKRCGERGRGADSPRRRRTRAAPVLPRPRESTKTVNHWRACALVTCSKSLARPCLSRGSPTQSNEEWALYTVGGSARRRQPRERSAAQHGLCEAAPPRADAAHRAHAACSPSAFTAPKSAQDFGVLSSCREVGQAGGGARRQFAGSRASERERRETATRAAAKGEHVLEVANAAGA
jgi:hypothetical protein